jgi:PAS domain S-box-containing protein
MSKQNTPNLDTSNAATQSQVASDAPNIPSFLGLLEQLTTIAQWSVDLVNQTLYWSEGMYQIHGLAPENYTPELDTSLDFYHPDDREKIQKFVAKAIETGDPYQFELRIVRPDGEIRYVRCMAQVQHDQHGKATRLNGLYEDVSDWFSASERYEQVKTVHQNYLDASNDGYWDCYLKQDYEYMSPRFWEILGYSPEEKPHKTSSWQSVVFNEDLKKSNESLQRHIESKGQHPYELEMRFFHKNGSTVTVLRRGSVVEWAKDGSAQRMIGTHTDISELKSAQDGLSHALSFQTLLLEVNTDLVFVKDTNLNIVLANPAFTKLYPEDSRHKIIGHSTKEQYPEEQAKKIIEQDRIAFENGFSEALEEVSFPDGSHRHLLTKKIRFESDGEKYILCLARDISDRVIIEEQLKRTNEELQEFAYRTSHDLRSPLISSGKLLEITQKCLARGDHDNVDEYISMVRSSLKDLEELVTNILNLTKSSQQDIEYERCHILPLVNNSLHKLEHLRSDKNIDVRIDIDSQMYIKTDATNFVLVLENLLSNAIKYFDPAKNTNWVDISCKKTNDNYLLEISDNGLGFPLESRHKIFSMFSRFHPKTSFGSGLGLYMVNKIVGRLGGDIKLNCDDNCTRFIVTLPEIK